MILVNSVKHDPHCADCAEAYDRVGYDPPCAERAVRRGERQRVVRAVIGQRRSERRTGATCKAIGG